MTRSFLRRCDWLLLGCAVAVGAAIAVRVVGPTVTACYETVARVFPAFDRGPVSLGTPGLEMYAGALLGLAVGFRSGGLAGLLIGPWIGLLVGWADVWGVYAVARYAPGILGRCDLWLPIFGMLAGWVSSLPTGDPRRSTGWMILAGGASDLAGRCIGMPTAGESSFSSDMMLFLPVAVVLLGLAPRRMGSGPEVADLPCARTRNAAWDAALAFLILLLLCMTVEWRGRALKRAGERISHDSMVRDRVASAGLQRSKNHPNEAWVLPTPTGPGRRIRVVAYGDPSADFVLDQSWQPLVEILPACDDPTLLVRRYGYQQYGELWLQPLELCGGADPEALKARPGRLRASIHGNNDRRSAEYWSEAERRIDSFLRNVGAPPR